MKTVIDPSTGQPAVDPLTGQLIDVSTRAGKRRWAQVRLQSRRAAAQARRAARRSPVVASPNVPILAGGVVSPYVSGIPTSGIQPYTPGCSGACFPNIGWLGPYITSMGAHRRWVMSMDPENQVIPVQTQPLILAHDSPASLVNACIIAVQGDGQKSIIQTQWPTPAADTTITLGAGINVFGVKVTIANSIQNFKFAMYDVQLLTGAATVVDETFVYANKLPVRLIILNISNVNGLASVRPNADARVRFLAASNTGLVPASDMLIAETLNMRDLGDVANVNNGGVINVR